MLPRIMDVYVNVRMCYVTLHSSSFVISFEIAVSSIYAWQLWIRKLSLNGSTCPSVFFVWTTLNNHTERIRRGCKMCLFIEVIYVLCTHFIFFFLRYFNWLMCLSKWNCPFVSITLVGAEFLLNLDRPNYSHSNHLKDFIFYIN